MTQSELVELLKHNVVSVTFVKVDGTERTMPCTLNESLMPVAPVHETNTPNPVDFPKPTPAKKANPGVVTVWCTDAAGWRSFRWDNFVSATVLTSTANMSTQSAGSSHNQPPPSPLSPVS